MAENSFNLFQDLEKVGSVSAETIKLLRSGLIFLSFNKILRHCNFCYEASRGAGANACDCRKCFLVLVSRQSAALSSARNSQCFQILRKTDKGVP